MIYASSFYCFTCGGSVFRVTDDGVQTRAHLEAQLESSLALKSPNEYRQCLLSYIRFLARCSFCSRLIICLFSPDVYE
jgi:hypothetical protein